MVYQYANYLSARGHTVRIIYPRRNHESETPRSILQPLKDYLRIQETRQRQQPLVPWFKLRSDVKLILTPDLKKESIPDADVTVATGWQTAGAVNILPITKGRKYYLIQSYEVWGGPKEKVDATWRMPLKKIVISKWLQQLGKELGVEGLRYIPNGLDFGRYKVTTPPEKRPLSILSLYHDDPVKGVSDALAVLSSFHDDYPEVPIAMFGTPARNEEIPDWITYFQNPAQNVLVDELYNGSAVYMGASLIEGWALPPAEAMACGCAFVGTDIGGFKDYAVHGETALLSSPGDREGLLHNLRAIAQDPQLLRRIQRAGTSLIQQFTWENSGAALEQYFMESSPVETELRSEENYG